MNEFSAPVAGQTRRLTLRRYTADDAKEIFETYAQDPEVTRFLTWQPHRSLDETRVFLDRCERVWAARTAYPWAITLREDGRIIGGIEARPDGHRVEFGYALARGAWRHGFATEAARCVVDLALASPSIHRVWAFVETTNAASARVLEKAGLSREGMLRKWYVPSGFGVPHDAWCYARIKGGEETP